MFFTTLSATLRDQAAVLRAAGEDWWTGYFDRLRREDDAAAERERAETDRLHALARSRH